MYPSLLQWLIAISLLAYLWPVEQTGFDPFLAAAWWLWSLIAITMFALGTLVQTQELIPLRQKPWWVALGVMTQVTVMPIAAWLVAGCVPMSPELAAGVILVGCVPGAMASNVLTHVAGGSVAYSVSLTSVATLLSPLTVPAVLFLVVREQPQVSLTESSIRLAMLVVLPTVVGHLCSRHIATLRELAGKYASLIASIALLWIIASVVAKTRDQLTGVGVTLVFALLLINLMGYAAGWSLGWFAGLPTGYRRGLSLEVGMQNAGLGTTLAVTLYGSETLAVIPTAAYTFGCMLTGTLLANFWRSRDRASLGATADSLETASEL